MLPTVRVDRLERLLGVAEIPEHYRAPSEADLALSVPVAPRDVLEADLDARRRTAAPPGLVGESIGTVAGPLTSLAAGTSFTIKPRLPKYSSVDVAIGAAP